MSSGSRSSQVLDITYHPIRGREHEHKFELQPGVSMAYLTAEFISRLLPWLREHPSARDTFFNGLDEYFVCEARQMIARYRRNMLREEITRKRLGGNVEDRPENTVKVFDNDPRDVRESLVWDGYVPDVVVNQSGYYCYLPDEVEIVIYRTMLVDGSRERRFIEIEALRPKSPEAAVATIVEYRNMLGIDPATQVQKSIFQMYRLEKSKEAR